ncbi:MAG: hypothetical protein ACLFU8_06200 [Anaerolineales bacterium]
MEFLRRLLAPRPLRRQRRRLEYRVHIARATVEEQQWVRSVVGPQRPPRRWVIYGEVFYGK